MFQQYNSEGESSESDTDTEAPAQKKTRGRAKEYELVKSFGNVEEFYDWKKRGLHNWVIDRNRELVMHRTEEYVCEYAHKNNSNYDCQAVLRIRKPRDRVRFIVEVAGAHRHEAREEKLMTPEVRDYIRELVSGDATVTASQAQMKIMLKFNKDIPRRAIENFISWERKKRGSSIPVTIQSLRKYAEENAEDNLPAGDPHRPIVLSWDEQSEKDEEGEIKHKFCLVWSTPHLSEMQILQVDGMYKLLWAGHIVLIAGFTDAEKVFFPTHWALVSNEDTQCYAWFLKAISILGYTPNVLLADAAEAITNAAKLVWPDDGCPPKRGFCAMHMLMDGVQKRFSTKELRVLRDEMLEEARRLQLATSDGEFLVASALLYRHLNRKYGKDGKLWPPIQSWFDNWVLRRSNWYEGFSDEVTTNNGLERFNRTMKDYIPKRLSMADFLAQMERIIQLRSRDPDHQDPKEVPSIDDRFLNWALELKVNKRAMISNGSVVVMASWPGLEENPTLSQPKVLEEHFERFKRYGDSNRWSREGGRFGDWEDYKQIRQSIHVVKKSSQSQGRFSCTCRYGVKKGVCKHAVYVMCREGLLEFPAPLEGKKKAGRQKKRGKALERT